MEVHEAKEFAKKKHPSIKEIDLENFIDKIGTLPLHIGLFCKGLSNEASADTLINKKVRQSMADLVAFAHKPILKALKNQPDGVNMNCFDGIRDEGVLLSKPKDVGVEMKSTKAVLFHFESNEYRLFSKAHKTAIKDYKLE
jgi:hypothetical protein